MDEMAEEHPPVRSEAPEEMAPVDLGRAMKQGTRHIGSVITLPLHDVGFHPDHLFHSSTAKRSRWGRSVSPAFAVSGGFGRRMLNAWDGPLIKQFVQRRSIRPSGWSRPLTKLQAERRVALMHYSPIRDTVRGEDPEIFPFLGSSHLEEPINRFLVSAVSSTGTPITGRARARPGAGVPVHNISLPLLRKSGISFRTVEL